MSNRFFSTLIVAITVLLTASWTHSVEITLSPTQIENLGIEFTVAKRGRSASIEAIATVETPPNQEFLVAPMVDGVVSRLMVMTGAQVQQGQALAQIRSTDYLTLQREFVDAVIHFRLENAQLTRDQSLLADGTIASRRVQEAQARVDAATADYRAHRQMLRLTGLLEREIDLLAEKQDLTNVLLVRSPSDGVVLNIMVKVGEHVDALSPVYHVADLSSLWLSIQLPVEQATDVSVGGSVTLLDAQTDVHATVINIGRQVDPQTQTIRVRAHVTSNTQAIRPGQLVAVALQDENTSDAGDSTWQVPTAAVVHDSGQAWVFIGSNNGFRIHPVTVFRESRGNSYIHAQLDASSRLAIKGITALKTIWLEQQNQDN